MRELSTIRLHFQKEETEIFRAVRVVKADGSTRSLAADMEKLGETIGRSVVRASQASDQGVQIGAIAALAEAVGQLR